MKSWLAMIALKVALKAAAWLHEGPCHNLAEKWRRELNERDAAK